MGMRCVFEFADDSTVTTPQRLLCGSREVPGTCGQELQGQRQISAQ